jgi:predicted trehalose synthase
MNLDRWKKTCYALCYEWDNRPDGIAIPLGDLCQLLLRPLKDEPR